MPSPDSTADRPPVVVPAPDPARDARVAARRKADAHRYGMALAKLLGPDLSTEAATGLGKVFGVGWNAGYAASEEHHNYGVSGPACTCIQASDTGHDSECPRADWARGNRTIKPHYGVSDEEQIAAWNRGDPAAIERAKTYTQQPPPCPDHRGLGDVNQLSCAWCGEERAAFYRRLADSR